jgi:hypothetical protein
MNTRVNIENYDAKSAKSNGILVDNLSKYGHNIGEIANSYLSKRPPSYSA